MYLYFICKKISLRICMKHYGCTWKADWLSAVGAGRHCRCPSTGPCQPQPLPLWLSLKGLSGHRDLLTHALDRWKCMSRINSAGSNSQWMTNGNWRNARSSLSLGQNDSEISSVCSVLTPWVPWSVSSHVPTVWICSFGCPPGLWQGGLR